MVEPNVAQWTGVDLLILLPVTGRSGGKRKRTVVTITYTMPSCYKMVSKGDWSFAMKRTDQVTEPSKRSGQYERSWG